MSKENGINIEEPTIPEMDVHARMAQAEATGELTPPFHLDALTEEEFLHEDRDGLGEVESNGSDITPQPLKIRKAFDSKGISGLVELGMPDKDIVAYLLKRAVRNVEPVVTLCQEAGWDEQRFTNAVNALDGSVLQGMQTTALLHQFRNSIKEVIA